MSMQSQDSATEGNQQDDQANKRQTLGASLNPHSSDNAQLKEILDEIKCINTLLERSSISSEESHDAFWLTYLKDAAKHDGELMERYKNDIDIVILFSTLFSAVVAAFVVAMQPALNPNPSDTTNTLLMILIHTINNSTLSDQPLSIPHLLSQHSNVAVRPFWYEAREKIQKLLACSTESDSITCLVRLLIVLSPVQDTSTGTRFHLRATQIPEQLLFWSLPFLRSALRRQSNQDLSNFFSTVPSALERVSFKFSDEPKWSASEQSSYFRACQVYLRMLEPAEYEPGTVVGWSRDEYRMRRLSVADWNVIRQLLVNLSDADISLRRIEDGWFTNTLKELSGLLRICIWPDDIRTSVHALAFAIYSGAKDQSTPFPRRLALSAIDFAAIDPDSGKYVYPDISQIRCLLLDYLVDSPSEDRSVYLLKLFKASSAQANKSLWLDVDVVNYLIDPARARPVQHITLEILSAACESPHAYLDDAMKHLICHFAFPNLISRAIVSSDSFRRTTGLQFLNAALPYLFSRQEERERWQAAFVPAIFQVRETDLPPKSRFHLIRIKCALYPEGCSGELSAYWARWMNEENGLEVAGVVPVAHWVLTNCQQPQPVAWYENLRGGFEHLLQVAWKSDFERDPASLHELINCTDGWRHSQAEGLAPNTIDILRDASNRILVTEKYGLGEDDVNALRGFSNL